MRIAQVAPLFESVPPQLYGGTERVVSYLTEELVRQGHEVTLFASGDSTTRARLVAPCPRSLRLDDQCIDQLAHHVVLLEQVFAHLDSFEIIHYHIDYLHFPLSRRHTAPHVTTLHGRLDIPDLVPLYQQYPEQPVVSISHAQRAPLPTINWRGCVYHGLPDDLYSCHEEPGQYLAFIGRISPEKGVDRAIELARSSGMPLKIAAKVDRNDRDYYEAIIKPLIDPGFVELVGELGDHEKGTFLGNACALAFLIDWPEPFGMAMIEAMACGTPVIAYGHGSVPEIVADGVSGFIVHSQAEAAQALTACVQLSRRACRRYFEARFTAGRMAQDYLAVYQELIDQHAAQILAQPPDPATVLRRPLQRRRERVPDRRF